MTTTVHENPGVFARANRRLTTTSHKDIGTLYLTRRSNVGKRRPRQQEISGYAEVTA